MIKCSFLSDCKTGKYDQSKCKSCKNNRLRNYEENHYVKANDNPIPEKCPKLRYDGPAEQTNGYICPVCGGGTNPYEIRDDKLCMWCGYELNI